MKKILNRIIASVLTFIMCLGGTVLPTFAEETNTNQKAIQAMEVLRLFDIVPEDYYDYNVNMNQEVSRADFVAAVAKLINLTNMGGNNIYYYDVPQTHWAFAEINALTVMGILDGQENRLFYPDQVIEKNEAYKLLVNILGYRNAAEHNGGYPKGYMVEAVNTGLTEGLSAGVSVTRSDMFLMLYNAMTAQVLEPVDIGTDSATYQTSDDKTLLSIYHDVYYDKGRLTGANCMDLYDGALASGLVRISGTDYETDLDMMEYLGEKIEFFYHYSGAGEQASLIWAAPTDKTKPLNITADANASFDKTSFTLTYYTEGSNKKRQVTLARNVVVVYNGGVVSSKIDEIFNEQRYTAKLVNTGSGYDVAVVRAYENVFVSSTDKESQTVYDKINVGKKLILDENLYDYMILQSAGGTNTDFASISADHVLSVYLSKDEKYLEVQIGAEQVSGTLDGISDDERGYILSVGGNEYVMPNTAQTLKARAGDSVTLYLDISGRVAYCKSNVRSDAIFAWIVNYYTDEDEITPILKLMMYTEDNEMVTLGVADYVNIDGDSCKTSDQACTALSRGDSNITGQLVRIKTKDDKITYIDTVYAGSEENGLFITSPYGSHTYMGSSVMGPRIRANGNTKVFVIPKSSKYERAEDAYSVTTMSAFFSTWTAYTTVGYRVGENEAGYTDAVVVWEDILGNSNKIAYAGIMIVSGQRNVWDEQSGAGVQQLIAQSGKTAVEYKCAEDYTLDGDVNIKEGNVITITTNKQGEINSSTLLYGTTKSGTEKKTSYAVAKWTTLNQTACGYITNLNDGMATLASEPNGTTILTFPTNVGIAVYDPNQRQSVFVGSEGDLADAMANSYRVVVAISRGTMQSIAVIKE